MDIKDLTDKTVVVTGAGSGIGKETALACARRGANLAICGVNEAGLAQTAEQARGLGREVLAGRVDVASRHEMRGFAAAVHQRVAAVDILMNNAGVGLGAGFLDTPLDDWDWMIGSNLMGVVPQ
jgi:NAD(P)-dependent dehydrogenase (short-subunit alcohol dehydrogenase family)